MVGFAHKAAGKGDSVSLHLLPTSRCSSVLDGGCFYRDFIRSSLQIGHLIDTRITWDGTANLSTCIRA